MSTPSNQKSLNDLLKKSGLTEKDLQQEMKKEHCHEIAIQVGKDWQALAAFIGIPDIDVDDIKERYQEPQDRRLALLRKWKKLYGQEATYTQMVHGLENISNRKLTESLISMLKTSKHGMKEKIKTEKRNLHYNRGHYKTKVAFICVLVSLLFSSGILNIVVLSRNEVTYIPHTQPNSSESTIVTAQWSNCSQPVKYNLPLILHKHFVGREDDIQEVISTVMRANIVNINGAPGIGKSTLAIHTGYRLMEKCISVRYINIEELSPRILSEFDDQPERRFSVKPSKNDRPKTQTAAVTTFASDSYLPTEEKAESIESQSSATIESSFIEELKQWSKDINNTLIILIFDNADALLQRKSLRSNFIRLIDILVQNSYSCLHIIIVSQERLLFLDNFDQWSVKELSQQASVELLSKLAPGIADGQLNKLAELVQGHPLALKVIGTILHSSGQNIIRELESDLEKQPIDILDKPSDHEQRFSVMMDSVLSKLDFLQECGYRVSLFPGSFSREAGIEILSSKKCLEMFQKHSFLDDYFLGTQHRYKMHWLISKYLKQKVNNSEETLFEKQFRTYYTQYLLDYTKVGPELSDLDEHMLYSESNNIHFLLTILQPQLESKQLISLNYGKISPEELAVLMFLVSIGHAVPYTACISYHEHSETEDLKYSHAIELLHPIIFGKYARYCAKNFYRRCRCDTVKNYINELLFSHNCTFSYTFESHCKRVAILLSIRSYFHLSQREEEFLYNMGIYNCLHKLTFKEIILSFQYYKKYLVLIPVMFPIFLTYILVLAGGRNRSVLLHAYNKLHFKYKYLAKFLFIMSIMMVIILYQGSHDEDRVAIVQIGIKLLCYTFDVFICTYTIVYLILYKFCLPALSNPSCKTNMLNMCIGTMLFIFVVVCNYCYLFDICLYVPICV